MLDFIKGQFTRSVTISKKQRAGNGEEILRRAPGIPKHAVDPVLKPITRASTEPVKASRTVSEDASALNNHWLFRESRGPPPFTQKKADRIAPGTEEKSTTASKNQLPLCGTVSTDVEHMIMGWQNDTKQLNTSLYLGIGLKTKPKARCPQCVILSETIERLRETLSRSTETSPKASPKLDTGDFPLPPTKARISSDRKAPEMRQIPSFVSRNSINGTQGSGYGCSTPAEMRPVTLGMPSSKQECNALPTLYRSVNEHQDVRQVADKVPSRTHPKIPESNQPNFHNEFAYEPRSRNSNRMAPIPHTRAQHRSVTYDGYSNTYPQQLLDGVDEFATAKSYYSNPAEAPTLETTSNSIPSSSRTFTIPAYIQPNSELAPTILPEAERHPERSSHKRLTGALDERQQLRSLRSAAPRPSLPDLRNVSTHDINARKGFTTLSSERQSTGVSISSIQEYDGRQRRSVVKSLRPAGMQSQLPLSTARSNPLLEHVSEKYNNPWIDEIGTSEPVSAYRQERLYKHNDLITQGGSGKYGGMYTGNRPGGEELVGIDYVNR